MPSTWDTSQEAIRRASEAGERVWSLSDTIRRRPYVAPREGVARSGVELEVEKYLVGVGMSPALVGVEVPSLVDPHTWVGTPDMVCSGVAVEVDGPRENFGGDTHNAGFPAADMYRSDCFRAAGIPTVRLRLGGLDPVPGCFNVCCSGAAKDGLPDSALVEVARAVRAASEGAWPYNVRLARVTESAPRDNVPGVPLECDGVHYLLKENGRWLFVNTRDVSGYDGKGWFVFLVETDLGRWPRSEWVGRLERLIPHLVLKDSGWSELPWGDVLAGAPRGTGDVVWSSKAHDPCTSLNLHVSDCPQSRRVRMSGSSLDLLDASGEVCGSVPLNPALVEAGFVLESATKTSGGSTMLVLLTRKA